MNFLIFTGSDPGPFFLARHGLYVRPLNTWVIFLVFRGNDVHGGTSPIGNQTTMSAWLEDLSPLYDKAGPVNRAVYVHYSGAVPCTRIAPTLVTPPVVFGNSAAVDYTSEYQTLSGHGLGIFGSKTALSNHLGKEAIFALHNTLRKSGLHLNMDLGDLMARITFEDEQGDSKALLPPPFDPVRDGATIELKRAWYSWFLSQLQAQAIRITKHQMKIARDKLKAKLAPQMILRHRQPLFIGRASILPTSQRSTGKNSSGTMPIRRYSIRQANAARTTNPHPLSQTNVSVRELIQNYESYSYVGWGFISVWRRGRRTLYCWWRLHTIFIGQKTNKNKFI